MIVPGCLVIQRSDGWEIILGDEVDFLAPNVDRNELAVCATLMQQMSGMKTLNVVLAPATDACFFVRLQPTSDVDTRDRSALAYELEDHLPIDAESMVADFVTIESPGDVAKTIGSVAIGTGPWDDIIEAFESNDLPVRSIVPAAILATRAFCEDADLAETVELFLIDGDRCDCIQVRNETILSWYHLSLDPPALRRHCLLDRLSTERTVIVGGNPQQQSMIKFVVPDAIIGSGSRDALIREGAKLLLDNRSQRWFDLRRDLLGPKDPLRAIGRQLRWVGVAAAACFLALAVGGWWRSSRIDKAIAQTQVEQAELFNRSFPAKRATSAPLRQVRSEHSRAMNSRGQNTDIEVPISAPLVLRQLLASLQKVDVRFHIERIDIRDGVVNLDVTVRRNSDAFLIREAILNEGFDVPQPSVGKSSKNEAYYLANLEATWVERPESSADNEGVSG